MRGGLPARHAAPQDLRSRCSSRTPRRPSSRPRRAARITARTSCSRSRWPPKIAPVAACASRAARPRTRRKPGSRRSTWRPSPRCASQRARELGFLPRPARGRPRHAQAGHGQGQPAPVRSSNSPAPAAAAARPPTSSCSASSSAIGPSSANATGCTSIYGGNLPTTPWCQDANGRGPAWSNSLFEDNAEFGLGFRLTADKQAEFTRELVKKLSAGDR